jgi:hypothetical protein
MHRISNENRIYIAIIFVVVITQFCNIKIIGAQSFNQSIAYELKEIRNDYFIGTINNKRALLLNTDTGFVIKLFNAVMAETETIVPKYLQKNIRNINVTALENKLNVYFTQNNAIAQEVYWASLSHGLPKHSKPNLLATIQTDKNTSKVEFKTSRNNKFTVIWYEQIMPGDSMDLFYQIRDNTKSEPFESKEFQRIQLGKIPYRFQNAVEISNQGSIGIISIEKDKLGNNAAVNILVPPFNNEKPISVFPDDSSATNYLLSEVNNFNNTLCIIEWQAVIHSGIPKLRKTVVDLKDGRLLSDILTDEIHTENDLSFANVENGFFRPKQIIFNSANECVCISEFYGTEVIIQNPTPMENMMALSSISQRSMRTINRYVIGNILISTIGDNAKINNQIVRKDQITDGQPSKMGSYALAVLPSGLHFLNNILERGSTIQYSNIKANSQMATKIIETTQNYEGVALFDHFYQISASQIIMPCFEHDGVSFLQISF